MTERKDFSCFFSPAATVEAANVVMALLNGDDPASSNSFSQPAVPADGPGNATPTYYYGGMPTTPAWTAALAAAAAITPPTPAGGWPVTGANSGSVSEAAALAAAEVIYVQTATTFNGSEPDAGICLAAGLSSLRLKQYSMFG